VADALSVQGLCVRDRYTGSLIVDGFELRLAAGEMVGLVGPSGSGKSTIGHALMGLLPEALQVAGGSASMGGLDILRATPEELSELRGKLIAFLPQDPLSALNPVLTCGRQVEEPLRLHTKLDKKQRRERVLALLAEMGLDDPPRIYAAFPAEVSGGQRQRVLMAMAVTLDPQVLVADEPTTALDAASAARVLGLLERLRERAGTSILLISHDLTTVRSRSSRVLAIDRGKPVPWSASHGRPQNPAVQPIDRLRQPRLGGEVVLVRNLGKSFPPARGGRGTPAPKPVLDEVSLSVRKGEIVGVIGESGSGKTTLGRCIAGLLRPERGQILVDGRPAEYFRRLAAAHPVQIVYQSPYSSLNPTMSLGESVEEGARSAGVPADERRQRAVRALESVGLQASLVVRRPAALSGGERQRVVIARCLEASPLVLVADEPTASLDDRAKEQVLALLRQVASERGIGVLLISHDLAAVERVSDRIYRLENGRLDVASGSGKAPAGTAQH
jgi:peptide/nickel transport system ATP-binding protein